MKKSFLKHVLGKVKRAMVNFQMLQDGDRVAVGLSGGKDSGVLLYLLHQVRRTAPLDFQLYGIFLDLGFGLDTGPLQDFCDRLGVPFIHQMTDIGEVVFETRQEKHPCALCANLRRGALNNKARELGCNKVALGHHLDDVVDTFFMSLFYNGQLRTFMPTTYLDRADLYMIRPLVYLPQEYVVEIAALARVPVLENPCPASKNTKRQEVKQLVTMLRQNYPELRERCISALHSADLQNLWGDIKGANLKF
ncbi:MAG: tRNA 2-thiocytidine biosynthesis TtcA family protein [Desulfurispora sp.]|uniref:tRNA 2-thiocytidine biosynthesis TtcA family protein n=1 Tax=Desulfurispora sp. TaxID=3014275 RepID=UPI00404B128F